MVGFDSKFCIVFNSGIPSYFNSLSELEKTFQQHKLSFVKYDIQSLLDCSCIDADFVFVIGGDGTILRTAKIFSKKNVPVLGLNIGRLGFLSQLTQDDTELAVSKILNNEFKVEKRLMLASNKLLALNDFVIKGVSGSRTGKFSLRINNKFVSEYIADGLIVSTPTGSTAYGLSAGGPVLFPMLDAVTIVPICPHTLSARPLVIPSTEKLTILSNEAGMDFNINIDGDDAGIVEPYIDIYASELKANLALLDDNFYDVLRRKFHWGVAPEK